MDKEGRVLSGRYFDRPLSSADDNHGYAGQIDGFGRPSPASGELEGVLRSHSSWRHLPKGAFHISGGRIILLRDEPVKPRYIPGQIANGSRPQTLTELLEAEDCSDTGPDGLGVQSPQRHQLPTETERYAARTVGKERPRREIRSPQSGNRS